MFNLTTGITTDLSFRAVEAASPRFTVETVKSDVHSLEEIEVAMKDLGSDAAAGLIFPPEPFTLQNSKPIVELVSQIPTPRGLFVSLFLRRGWARVLWDLSSGGVSACGRVR